MQLKKLEDQVIVITGASSGVGLATARMAAERGAKVVLGARSEDGLRKAMSDIEQSGGKGSSFVLDVADEAAVTALAAHAAHTFGRIDTWINNAAVGIYGRLEDLSISDMRRVMEVDFWGAVYGCRAAIPHLRRAGGGALITVGSIASDVAMPLLGMYSAAKHAVRAFIDALRIELEKERAPIAVTLVKPGSLDTPFFEHAGSFTGKDPTPPPPVYAPELVARTILSCAETPKRDVFVGGSARLQSALFRRYRELSDRLLRATYDAQQREPRPGRAPEGALYVPHGTHGLERGDYSGRVLRRSATTYVSLHPLLAAATLGAAGLGVSFFMRS